MRHPTPAGAALFEWENRQKRGGASKMVMEPLGQSLPIPQLLFTNSERESKPCSGPTRSLGEADSGSIPQHIPCFADRKHTAAMLQQ